MKYVGLFILATLLSPVALGQDSQDASGPPDLTVVKKNWRRYMRYNRELDRDPFEANDAHREAMRAQREANRINEIRVARGDTAIAVRAPAPKVEIADPKYSDTYSYKAKVRNTGAKTMRLLVWEYVFVEPETGKEVGRHQYASRVKIKPGKTQELVGYSYAPPNRVVDASRAGTAPGERLAERIEIYLIEYDDGSTWIRTDK